MSNFPCPPFGLTASVCNGPMAKLKGSLSVPCSRCSQNRTLWETCMKAPNMPGLGKEDALGGACPGCYYNGTGNTCSNRPPTVKKTKAQPAMSSVADAESSSEAASVSLKAYKHSCAPCLSDPFYPTGISHRCRAIYCSLFKPEPADSPQA